MKPIELTQDHINKLKEMINKLFPKKEIEIDSYDDVIVIEFWKKGYIEYSIHWFEFCSRYLMSKLDELYIEKVLDPVDPFGKSNDYGKGSIKSYPDNWKDLWENRIFYRYPINLNGEFPKTHPVDYLYQEFKKL